MIKRVDIPYASVLTVLGKFPLHFKPVGLIVFRINCLIQLIQLRVFFMDVCQNPLLVIPAQVQILKPVLINEADALFQDLPEISYPRKTGRHEQDGLYPIFMKQL